LAFARFWNLMVSVFWVVILGSLFIEREVHFTGNGISKIASIEDWEIGSLQTFLSAYLQS